MKKKKEQMRVGYLGMNFLLDKSINEYSGEISVVISCVNAAKMIRQFTKENFGKTVKIWVRSESFSGGSSITVDVCNPNGTPLDTSIFESIQSFALSLKAGSFNGMIDSYEYNASTQTDNGTKLDFYTSYISVNNSPKYGTTEYAMWNEITQMNVTRKNNL